MRRGLSLLETIFAIAILGMALAAIGRLVQIGFNAGGSARVYSEGQIICDSKMAEIASGVLAAESSGEAAVPESPLWRYSVDVQPADQIGLLIVKVTVKQAADTRFEYTISRFLPDPNFEFNEPTE